MNEASQYLLTLARRLAAAYIAEPRARAIMVTGSAAEGRGDSFSDLDICLYYDELPAEEALDAARRLNRGSDRLWLLGDPEEGSIAEAYAVDGVECQFSHSTIAAWECDMAAVLGDHDVTSPLQKTLSGLLECVPLHGEPLIREWQAAAARYPAGLARAMVEHHLNFFPLWGLHDRLAARDATIWRYQILVEAAYNLLGILAGLNRLYFSTFQFKRMGRFVHRMSIAPPHLASRLENLFDAERRAAADQLEALVRETLDLVDEQMPEVDTAPARQKLGWRQRPWMLPPPGKTPED